MIAPLSFDEPVLVGSRAPFSRTVAKWLVTQLAGVNAAAQQIAAVVLTAQSASIATTAINTLELGAGLYAVTWYARITQAATTSSSLTVSITGIDGGVTSTQSSAALTGNTTGTAGSGRFLVQIDAATTLRYATTYASAGATVMRYALELRAERLP
ncbi:MAG TPA: hypothetical protein VNJ04_12055 [Gemmatimonadaceae bacterium]|nr:hypothetical protein [Gemmatimonadaceae bacterium]